MRARDRDGRAGDGERAEVGQRAPEPPSCLVQECGWLSLGEKAGKVTGRIKASPKSVSAPAVLTDTRVAPPSLLLNTADLHNQVLLIQSVSIRDLREFTAIFLVFDGFSLTGTLSLHFLPVRSCKLGAGISGLSYGSDLVSASTQGSVGPACGIEIRCYNQTHTAQQCSTLGAQNSVCPLLSKKRLRTVTHPNFYLTNWAGLMRSCAPSTTTLLPTNLQKLKSKL